MTDAYPVVVHHNPACGTSRNVLALIEAAGRTPVVIEYLKTGWTRDQLHDLLTALDARPREILREKQAIAAELGLTDPSVGDEAILDAMVAHPVLVNRPIVVTPKGARLCRPAELVKDLL